MEFEFKRGDVYYRISIVHDVNGIIIVTVQRGGVTAQMESPATLELIYILESLRQP